MAQVTICDCCGKQHEKMQNVVIENDQEFTDPCSCRTHKGEDHFDICPNCLSEFVPFLRSRVIADKDWLNDLLRKFIKGKMEKRGTSLS